MNNCKIGVSVLRQDQMNLFKWTNVKTIT